MRINGQDISIQLADAIDPIQRYYMSVIEKSGFLSTADPATDNYQDYWQGEGTMNNALGVYDDSILGTMVPRGGHDLTFTFGQDPATSCVVSGTLREPLLMPPMLYTKHEMMGLTNL